MTRGPRGCPFTFWTNVDTVAAYTQIVPASIRSRLGGVEGSVLDQFGGEYEWDNWTVKLHKNRGVTTPTVTLKYGKNITDLSQEEEIASTITGICPYWIDSNTGIVVILTEKAVESQYANAYAYRRTIPLDLSQDFDGQPTESQLRTKAQAYVNQAGIGIPKVSIKVSFVNLADTEEYKNVVALETVKLCDVVNVYFEKLGISTTAKVVKTVYNVLSEKYNSIEIGNVKTDLATTISNTDGAITAALSRANFNMSQMSNDLQEDIDNATAWLTSSGGYVIANKDNNGNWTELFFASSTNLTASSTKVLRINNNGIGFSGSGINGPYTQAWTLDGKLVVGGTNVPSLTVYNSNGQILFQIDGNGMEWTAAYSSMTKNGVLTANQAKITGSLTVKNSNNQTIFEVDSSGIYWNLDKSQMARNGKLTVSDIAINGGSITIKNAQNTQTFSVTSEGKLTAKGAVIEGEINATSGTFGAVNANAVLVNGTNLKSYVDDFYYNLHNEQGALIQGLHDNIGNTITQIVTDLDNDNSDIAAKINNRIDNVKQWVRDYFVEKRYYNGHKHEFVYIKPSSGGESVTKSTHACDSPDEDS